MRAAAAPHQHPKLHNPRHESEWSCRIWFNAHMSARSACLLTCCKALQEINIWCSLDLGVAQQPSGLG